MNNEIFKAICRELDLLANLSDEDFIIYEEEENGQLFSTDKTPRYLDSCERTQITTHI